jgi:predicted nucleic acid binding AN1-type Zn finger protein
MISISSFPKTTENKESIIFTFENIKTIYELKKNLSEKIKMPIGEIFIYSTETPNLHYENSVNIYQDIQTFYYKTISNRCAICAKKSTMITGDCNYCACHYCNIHRLPENHACPCLDKCKTASFQENYNRVISQKCVIEQIKSI